MLIPWQNTTVTVFRLQYLLSRFSISGISGYYVQGYVQRLCAAVSYSRSACRLSTTVYDWSYVADVDRADALGYTVDKLYLCIAAYITSYVVHGQWLMSLLINDRNAKRTSEDHWRPWRINPLKGRGVNWLHVAIQT